MDLFCTDFLHGFLHGFFARIFCTDFLHGFVARICCTDLLHGFVARNFLRGVIARIVAWIFARTFETDFLGRPKALAEKCQKSTDKIPRKFSMLWGPSGAGLGRQEGEVETLANLTKPSLGLRGGGHQRK